MISKTTRGFRRMLEALPPDVIKRAYSAYRRFAKDPLHPSLHFKKLPPRDDVWSVRISDDYRAVGVRREHVIIWFFIGTHADYDRLLSGH